MSNIPFSRLEGSDLFVDSIYKGGNQGHAGDDPISKLMGTGNQGGFRYVGSLEGGIKLCVLYSSLSEPDWPDRLNPETGRFIYFGDNRTPGHELHDTNKKGNEVLRRSFSLLHNGDRCLIPPFFIFTKGPDGRDVIFRGLAVPGAPGLSGTDDLVAVWKTAREERFQNYRATFSILDESTIAASWIQKLISNDNPFDFAPEAFQTWVESGRYSPLIAPKVRDYRTRSEQLPGNENEKEILDLITGYFKNHPKGEYAFEKCAAELAKLLDKNISQIDLTQPWRDGGRDAVGKYIIGHQNHSIKVDFAIEQNVNWLLAGRALRRHPG